MTFQSSTRALVIASAIVASIAEAYLATAYAPTVFWIAVAGFALMLGIGSRLRQVAMPLLMTALYLTPALLLVSLNAKGYEYDAIWILPLLGLLLSDRGAWQTWSLPGRWQWPLITWSAIVAVSWPIVFLREADFTPWILLQDTRVSNTSIGLPPSLVVQSVTYFAIGHTLGILFIDALYRWYGHDRAHFRRDVLAPLAAAAGIAAAVAVYQGFVDLGFLNEGFWEYMIRASGTLGDPNKLGAVAAFWTIGSVAFAMRLRQPWNVVVSIGALVGGISAVWLSGSRTGLAAVVFSVTIAGVEALRFVKLDVRKLAIAIAAAVAIGGAMIVVLQNASTHTVVQRGTLGYLPFLGDRGIAASANELLWDRFGYGPTAIQMIKEHPLDGVGVGTFHTLSHDYGKAAGREIPAPDNAQAWWRHNLAELGVIGFIPMLWWCVVFGRALLSRNDSGDRLSSGMLRGVVVAFFVASLFGLPSQSVAITITFWVFVFWFSQESRTAQSKRLSQRLVVLTIVLVVVHGALTIADGFGDLRPRNRAQRFGWYYRYGWVQPDDVEADPGGNPVGRRWTTRKSLAVIPVKGKVLKFVAWIDHPDADTRPVHTQVWADGKLVYEGDLGRTPLFMDIPATPGRTHLILETAIDRTFRPSDSGNSRDSRELGLSVRDFVWQ